MWKRDDTPRPAVVPSSPAVAASQPSMVSGGMDETRGEQRIMQQEPASIGKSIVIRGEVSGSEDLTVEGQVEGKIELRDHILTVGSNGHLHAHIVAKSIIVLGQVTGNLTADEKVDIREKGSVEGDIVAPRVAIADGANFRGSIDMRREAPSTVTDWTAGSLKSAPTTPTPATREPVSV